jgi:hypothetical protein
VQKSFHPLVNLIDIANCAKHSQTIKEGMPTVVKESFRWNQHLRAFLVACCGRARGPRPRSAALAGGLLLLRSRAFDII